VYLYLHSPFHPVQQTSRFTFVRPWNALLPSKRVNALKSKASVYRLAPLHCLRMITRPVSYYALFEGMAASKPTSWLSSQSHIISHLAVFRDLSCRSGLFPSRLRSLSPAVSLPSVVSRYSEFGWVWYPVTDPSPSSALPPRHLLEAVPQGISESASYFQVCLAFHPLSPVIPAFFITLEFGPPLDFTQASTCK
jgi:hypothetical protein